MADNGEMVPVSGEIAIPSETPQEKMEFAQKVAEVVMDVVSRQGLAHNFGGKKDHLDFEAWSTIANSYNCALGTEWVKTDTTLPEGTFGYVARAYVKHKLSGEILATAEASCSRDEKLWKNKPAFQLRSMAQTRAGSKAARMVFSWVAVLAGYSATPAEEMDGTTSGQGGPPQKNKPKATAGGETVRVFDNEVDQWAKDHNVTDEIVAAMKKEYFGKSGTSKKGRAWTYYNWPKEEWENGPLGIEVEGETPQLDDVDDTPFEPEMIPIEPEDTREHYDPADKEYQELLARSDTIQGSRKATVAWLKIRGIRVLDGDPIPKAKLPELNTFLDNLEAQE